MRFLFQLLTKLLFLSGIKSALAIALQTDPQGAFQGIDNGETTVSVFFTVVPSGNYVLGGDVLDFTKIGDFLKSSRPPLQVYIQSQKTGGNTGWWYTYVPGNPPTQSNGKMQVFGTGGGAGLSHQELAGGTAYSAAAPRIDTDVIVGVATFPRL